MKLINDFIKIAEGELGKTEIPLGSNWGTHVRKYLASVGINFPASWCMAYVCWCLDEAYKLNGLENPFVKSGGVLRFWQFNKDYRVKDPEPGDIFIMDFGRGLGHTGIVLRVDPTFIYTIEGNTNDSGSREGIEVARRQRPRTKILGYIRLK